MASEKRKATGSERPSKRPKNEYPSDKPRKPRSDTAKPDGKAEKDDRKSAKSSLLQPEERAFPRGGASVLTPLEHKQIKLDAEQDVLFEQNGKSTGTEQYDDEETEVKSRQDKKRRKTSKETPGSKDEKDHAKIQGLSYKTLIKDAQVLGQVAKITSRDIALSLPNNLTGYVPLTSISARLNKRISDILDGDKAQESDDEGTDDDIKLEALFNIGQYLRATVVATSSETSSQDKRSKRHIELSVNPTSTNTSLSSSDIKINTMIQASVKSVEDHGLVMDLGLEDESYKGFMSKKELGKSWDLTSIQEGQVFLCCVTGLASDGKVFKLCADHTRIGDPKKHMLTSADNIAAFLPGTAVEVLVTDVSKGGIVGKIMGLLDATCDITHTIADNPAISVEDKFKVGQKVTARVLCDFPDSEPKKVAVSVLPHVVSFQETRVKKKSVALESSQIIDKADVVRVDNTGLFLDLGTGLTGYGHISKLSDDKITSLGEITGPYRLGSSHKARVLGFNSIDGVYNVSLQKSVLDRAFLSIEDVRVGADLQVTVDKIIFGTKGVAGVVVELCEGITGLIPEAHMADVRLTQPEKKFRDGANIKARVLSVNLDKRQIRLTAKKTLLGSDAKWQSYANIKTGDESPGTIINVLSNGAVVQFYGDVRAWLPVAEMSEAYITDPAQHFRVGQTVKVRATDVDAEAGHLKVSCKDSVSFTENESTAWDDLAPGQLVDATISEISPDTITFDVDGGIKATLRPAHLTDKLSESAVQSASKQLRLGQKLTDLLILQKLGRRHVLVLTNKPSLVKAAKANAASSFEGLRAGQAVKGFVRNVTPDGVFVELVGELVGFLPKSQITKEKIDIPSFGLRKDESITSTVLSLDEGQKRFVLTLKEAKKAEAETAPAIATAIVNPVDGVSTLVTDFTLGKETQAKILSIKDTQLNVQLADNIQGRIDVSEVFDDWTEINDRKRPLQKFKTKQVLPVRILGMHDARNHRFLPITHRSSRVPVFELTAKKKATQGSEVLTLKDVKAGSDWIAFVNNIADNCLWVNITPNIRGRVDLLDLSNEFGTIDDLAKSHPVGSAIKVQVKAVDAEKNRLDLVAASKADKASMSLQDLSVGMTLPCKVVKTTDRGVVVSLGGSLTGFVGLTELGDDYDTASTSKFTKNHIMRASIVDLDAEHAKVYLSLRPSKLLSSALPVKDAAVTTIEQVKLNDIRRGFVKQIQDRGIIVSLGPRVDAFVRVSDLSDAYIKDWASEFKVNQLVKGRILAVDSTRNHVRMSLKVSHFDPSYVAPVTLADLKVGQNVTGKIRKVEDFGVFIDVDQTQPRVSGLCHKSQIADNKSVDVRSVYEEGDKVKARILKIDLDKRQISFGLKASFFVDDDGDAEMSDDVSEAASDGGVDLAAVPDLEIDDDDNDSDDNPTSEPEPSKTSLKTTGFDWTASAMEDPSNASDSEPESSSGLKKRKRRTPAIYTDKTGELDNSASSNVDFERLLLTSPHSSDLWVQYMAFQLQLGEISAAREIGRRALRTIHIREQDEKLAVWTALLNLEVSFGSEETLAAVFDEAIKMQDSFTIHSRMAEIWTQAGQVDKADAVYTVMVGRKEFRAMTGCWVQYATFLFENMQEPDRARGLLSRALQSVRESEQRDLTARFAALEWNTATGDVERGRTIFEGMMSQWPKWTGGWDIWVDLEKGVKDGGDEKAERVRALFERMSQTKMKKRRARTVFKKWLEFEEGSPSREERHVDRVKAMAKQYVEAARAEDEE